MKIGCNELARLVGVSRSYMSCIERGVRSPAPDIARKIASILGIDEGLVRRDDTVGNCDGVKDAVERVRHLFHWQFRAFRMSRGLSVHALCESTGGRKAGLKAWKLREYEIGGQAPSAIEMTSLAAAFGFDDVCDFKAELHRMGDDIGAVGELAANMRAATRLRDDGDERLSRSGVPTLSEGSFICDPEMVSGSLGKSGAFFLKGAQILGDRSAPVGDGDLVLVVNGFAVLGVGRVSADTILDFDGRKIVGEAIRITNILWR